MSFAAATPAMRISMFLMLAMAWGSSYFFAEIALAEVSPAALAASRAVIGAIVLNAILLARGQRLPASGSAWIAIVIMALFNMAIPFAFLSWGQARIPGALAAVLNSTAPLIAALISFSLLGRRELSIAEIIAVMIGVGGVAVLMAPDTMSGAGASLLGQFAVLCAATSYAIAGILGSRFSALQIAPMAFAAGQVTIAALLLLAMYLVSLEDWPVGFIGVKAATAIFLLGSISTAMAFIAYYYLIYNVGAVNTLLVSIFSPVISVLLGYFFLSTELNRFHILGTLLVISGGFLKFYLSKK